MMNINESISKIINNLGYTLSESQPHVSGERFLMSRTKLVLVGNQISSGNKVIIKLSDNPDGQKEISQEKNARDFLSKLAFAEGAILFPKELFYEKTDTYLVWITEFIDQEKVFVSRALDEQFFIALQAFEAQESFHATTYEHVNQIRQVFQVYSSNEYISTFAKFGETINRLTNNDSFKVFFSRAQTILLENTDVIDRYSNYLIHTDFVPHNFRVKERQIYMLDCSSVGFGNKYDGWARFLNYMLIHNPDLEKMLLKYIIENRGKDEYLNLRLMRLFKIGFLLNYYCSAIERTSGDLKQLTELRISFWIKCFTSILENTDLPEQVLPEYLASRDKLRSSEEKQRQKEFAIA